MRLLFITATRIGDAVLTTGLLEHFRRAHPGIAITVACGALPAPLFQSVPGLERLIVLAKRRYGLHWLMLWRQVMGSYWDIVVDLRRSPVPYLLRKGRQYRAPHPQEGRHRVAEIAAAARIDPPPSPCLWLSARDSAQAAELVPPGSPVLALAPAANWRAKQWPAERFAELTGRLTGPSGILPGARVAVLAAGTERAQAMPVLEGVAHARRIDLTGIDLAVAAACLERAALFVGNDSGLMHMAAAVGTPTLGLFGPSPESRYAPWGPHSAVVRTRESYKALVTAPGFDHRSAGCLMESLSVDAAAAAAEELWRRAKGKAA